MINRINYTTLIPYFICTTSYLFSAIINITIVEQILVLNESSSSVLDRVYHYDILGYSIAGLLLFIFSVYLNFRKITIFSLLIYIICTFNIGFFEFSGIVQKIYPIIYSGTNLLIITTLLCYIFNNNQIKREYLLSFFILSWSIAYFLAHLLLSYKSFKVISVDLIAIRELVILNTISIGIFLFIFISNPYFKSLKYKTVNSLLVLKNVDLELLGSFSIFYIMMAVLYSYELYQFTDTLLTITISEIKYYILFAMLFVSILAPKFVFKYNHHKINILCIATLLFTILAAPFWNNDLALSSFCWFIIASALYLYFCSNLLIIATKFTQSYLQLATILYMLAGSIGYYCSYIIMENIENTDNEYNLLISICFVLFSLFTYYLYRYKKYNLGKW